MSEQARVADDVLRSELIFLPDDGTCRRIDDDATVVLTPSNPGYWWGNTLRMARAPRDGDLARWSALFTTHVHRVQPASTHMTFGWAGTERGAVDPFVDAGFEYFETIVLVATRSDAIVAPHPAEGVAVERLDGPRWNELRDLLVVTRDALHTEASYIPYANGRIDNWRALERAGQGGWYGVIEGGRLASALGLYVEAARGADGRRIGRFQNVTTHPDARRRGYAGILVEHASRAGFDDFDADLLMILADENATARRVYEAAGYRIVGRQRGLERGREAALLNAERR